MAIPVGGGAGTTGTKTAPRPTDDPKSEIDAILGALFGGGGTEDLSAAISQSYDGQIAAYDGMLETLGASGQQLIDGIGTAAGATNQQIGQHFGYAADQANAGRPVIAETGQQAQGNVDAIYDDLAASLGGMPEQSVARASEAAGGAIGGSVAGRVAAATAPFEAAGETSRANTKANLTQHSAAGQDYLSQIASSAPSEAAQKQGAVSAQANQAVTEAEMAMAQQRGEIAMQTAALEGAKQRALIEHSADTAGSTMQRLMQTTQLYNALGADTGPLLDALGLEADPTGGLTYEDQLDIGLKEQRLKEATAGPDPLSLGGDPGFNAALEGTSQGTQNVANALRQWAEQGGDGEQPVEFADILDLLAPETYDVSTDGMDGSQLSLGGSQEITNRAGGNRDMQALLEELLGGWTAFSADDLENAFRAWYQ